MHRDHLLGLLERYAARFPAEGEVAERIRGLVVEHANCFERTCLPGHVTGSAWVVSPDGERCLLTLHRKLGRWLQLGGHADGDPLPERVALREAREESGLERLSLLDADGRELSAGPPWPPPTGTGTGQANGWPALAPLTPGGRPPAAPPPPLPLDLDVHRIPARGDEPGHEHHDVRYLLVAEPGQAIVASDESHELGWFSVAELARLDTDESVLRLARKARVALERAFPRGFPEMT